MSWWKPYRVEADVLPANELEQLRTQLRACPYLAKSDLSNRFTGTYGFSIAFTRDGIDQVRRTFPYFEPYLKRVLDDRCNAFYINPLLIYEGAGVDAHADRTLLSFTLPQMVPYPMKTSVLYVDVPEGLEGGELVIYLVIPIGKVVPRPNRLVEFVGTLRHAVKRIRKSGGQPRLSLVCEQYSLKPQLLELIPTFFLSTDRKFDEFLEDALTDPAHPEGQAEGDADDGG